LTVFLAAAARLRERAPDLRIVLPTVPAVAAKVRAVVDGGATPVTVVEGVADQNDLFAALHLALAASGTATLELALAEVPTVVAYKVHPLTALIGRRVVDMSTVVLTNRILGRPVQPFFVQENCRPEDLVTALAALLPAGAARDAQIAAGGELRAALRPDDRAAAARAADCLMALMRP
ncbi:MAG: lipid-A-disaccharide synthase, partial [Pseudomonadota bacterium]|nr:lipid-A-disaccharide synthase [Pseudomonadota bacterium]